MDREALLATFLNGLLADLQDDVRLMALGNVHEALMLALKYEHKWKTHLRKKEFRRNYFGNGMDKNQIGFKGGGLSQGYDEERTLSWVLVLWQLLRRKRGTRK